MKHFVVAAAALAIATGAVAQSKPLIVGFDGTFAPHAMPKMGGGIEGFNVDLILEAGKRMKRKIEIYNAEFSGLIPAMNAGKIDFIGAPTTVTPERTHQMLFSEGYLNTFYAFVAPASKPDFRAFTDLKGKTLSTNKGTPTDKWLQDNAAKYSYKSQAYGTTTDAIQSVITGHTDATLTGNTVAAYAVLRSNRKLKLTTLNVDQGLVWGAAFRKDDTKLRNAFEDALECMKLDGTVVKLAEKWFGSKAAGGPAAVTVFPGYGVPGLGGYDATPHTPKCK